ncbi:MAG: DUF1501 domain-containing protein [Fuerstiella sp.]
MNSYPCGRIRETSRSRRDFLQSSALGFGSVALADMFSSSNVLGASGSLAADATLETHFPAQARSVIFLYMDGGVSQVDSFDPKPRLTAENGKPFAMKKEPTQFNNAGQTLGSLWEFQKHGECGTEVSDLFPNIAKHVDDMSVIRSMVSNFPEHTNANYFLHTGHGQQGRPSMGAWFGYGLGSECSDLPHYVVLNGGLIPPGGLDNFGSGFLPASHQGSLFANTDPPVADLNPVNGNRKKQQKKLDLIRQIDAHAINRYGRNDAMESAISNYELAARMQLAVPDLMELTEESKDTQEAYGVNHSSAATASYGRQCLIARRLVERGVRFIQLTCPAVGTDRWDQHNNLKDGHTKNALAVDQPISALLADLKARDLLDSTLVVFSGEFGRTPFAQGKNGRDHNQYGFSMWMAGGGVKGGEVYGSTDEFGYKAIENKVEIHDLHATMLHLFGVDHERLTHRFGGRDMRLTDVHGHVLHDILV